MPGPIFADERGTRRVPGAGEFDLERVERFRQALLRCCRWRFLNTCVTDELIRAVIDRVENVDSAAGTSFQRLGVPYAPGVSRPCDRNRPTPTSEPSPSSSATTDQRGNAGPTEFLPEPRVIGLMSSSRCWSAIARAPVLAAIIRVGRQRRRRIHLQGPTCATGSRSTAGASTRQTGRYFDCGPCGPSDRSAGPGPAADRDRTAQPARPPSRSNGSSTRPCRPLAVVEGVSVATDEIDARLTKEATTPEERHAWLIEVKPVVDLANVAPTATQKADAKAKADAALKDLQSGKAWEDVAKTGLDRCLHGTPGGRPRLGRYAPGRRSTPISSRRSSRPRSTPRPPLSKAPTGATASAGSPSGPRIRGHGLPGQDRQRRREPRQVPGCPRGRRPPRQAPDQDCIGDHRPRAAAPRVRDLRRRGSPEPGHRRRSRSGTSSIHPRTDPDPTLLRSRPNGSSWEAAHTQAVATWTRLKENPALFDAIARKESDEGQAQARPAAAASSRSSTARLGP